MHLGEMSRVLVGFHNNTHSGQDIPALIGHRYHCTAVPIALDFLPISSSDRDRTRNAIALCNMPEILHDRAADNFEKLLTVIGNDLPVFNG